MFEYNCELIRIIDGDTIVVSIDLGFSVWMRKETVRMLGIDTPESRTRNLEEKKLGLASKARLKELLPKRFRIQTTKQGKGKFGRILAVPIVNDINICSQLVDEGFARYYYGGKKQPWV